MTENSASVSGNPPPPAVLERQVAEISILEADSPWPSRFEQAASLAGVERNLALDALSVQVSRALSAARQRAALRSRANALVAELAVVDATDAASWRDRLIEASTPQLEAIMATVASRVAAAREAKAAQGRRDAVLAQLAALGYQVDPGMGTVWVDSGRIVVENPEKPGYGVEVSGGKVAGKIQVRPVSYAAEGAAADLEGDRDAETEWCTDVATMQAELRAAGGELIIERQTPVGVTPVKRVRRDKRADERRRETTRPQQRRTP